MKTHRADGSVVLTAAKFLNDELRKRVPDSLRLSRPEQTLSQLILVQEYKHSRRYFVRFKNKQAVWSFEQRFGQGLSFGEAGRLMEYFEKTGVSTFAIPL